MQNTELYVKYRNNQPVPIYRAYGKGPTGNLPLTTVADLVAAYFPNTPPFEIAQYTLHYSENENELALAGNCPLSNLSPGTGTFENPFVIRSFKDVSFFIYSNV